MLSDLLDDLDFAIYQEPELQSTCGKLQKTPQLILRYKHGLSSESIDNVAKELANIIRSDTTFPRYVMVQPSSSGYVIEVYKMSLGSRDYAERRFFVEAYSGIPQIYAIEQWYEGEHSDFLAGIRRDLMKIEP